MFALVKLVFACLQHFLVFRMFDISDVCPEKAAFRMFAALLVFGCLAFRMVAMVKLVFG